MAPRHGYVYIRADRLDELMGQRLAETGRDKRRFKFTGFQVVGTGVTGEQAAPDPRAEFHRELEAIERYIDGATGEVDKPAEYFHGIMDLYMAPFADIESPFGEIRQQVAYFTGATSRTVLMLAGPLADLAGSVSKDPTRRQTAASLLGEPQVAMAVAEAARRSLPEAERAEGNDGPKGWLSDLVWTYGWMSDRPDLLPQEMEFVAATDIVVPAEKTPPEMWSGGGPKNVLIGKPLFVARRR